MKTDLTNETHSQPGDSAGKGSGDASPASREKILPNGKTNLWNRPLALLILFLLMLAGLIVGTRYYIYASTHESTDDAFIDGHIIRVSPRVDGHILKVCVNDNQVVKEGDLLVQLDPLDFQARLAEKEARLGATKSKHAAARDSVELTRTTSQANLDQARAGLKVAESARQTARARVQAAQGHVAQAQAKLESSRAQAEESRHEVAAFQAEASRVKADLKRLQQLFEKDEVSAQQLEHGEAAARESEARLQAARQRASAAASRVTEAGGEVQAAKGDLEQAKAGLVEARARLTQARAELRSARSAPTQVAVSQSQATSADSEISETKATVRQAELELSYTEIRAPESGKVTQKSAEEGAYVQKGQPLMVIVPDTYWVTANFKETQLSSMRPGQPAEIHVDAYPNVTFKGYVDSIQSGSGARFSLLPPENATGNYVKVVQRVPVKIVFDESPGPEYVLGPGMSVVPEVQVSSPRLTPFLLVLITVFAALSILFPFGVLRMRTRRRAARA